MIRDRIRVSCYYLPGEIAMSEEIGASRITLRKAMAILEQEGLIRRDRVRTEILEPRDILSACGKILFTAGAHYSTFFYPAVERLWNRFNSEVLSRDGNVELFCNDHTTSPVEWEQKIAAAEVIFLTSTGSSRLGAAETLLQEASPEKIIFSLLESENPLTPNCIYLDNYRVGVKAAQALIAAGCRNIGAVSMDHRLFGSPIFPRRMNGFINELQKHGLFNPDAIRLIPFPSSSRFNPDGGDNYSKNARIALEQAYAAGDDGVFVSTDEEIGLIAMNLFRNAIIPGKLKLLTFNGVGDAMRHNPPISCLSHGTHRVVAAALEQLKLIAKKQFVAPVNIAVSPLLYNNFTLSDESAMTGIYAGTAVGE